MGQHHPERIPIFPLPDTVLLPGETLEVLVLEARHLEMVRRALAWNARLGIVMMQPGWEAHYSDPPLFRWGGLGSIVQAERLNASGELSLRVKGLERFEIVRCVRRTPTIEAEVRYPEPDELRKELPLEALIELVARLQRRRKGSVQLELNGLSFAEPGPFIDRLARAITLRPNEKQALLGAAGLPQRFAKLQGFLRSSLFDIELVDALRMMPVHVMHAN